MRFFLYFLPISLLLHLFFFVVVINTHNNPKNIRKNIEISIVSIEEIKKEKSIEKIIDKDFKEMQVVEQSDTALNDERPENTKLLSKHNQKVVKQTKAIAHGDFQNVKNINTQNENIKKANPLPKISDLKLNPIWKKNEEVVSNNDSYKFSKIPQNNNHLLDNLENSKTQSEQAKTNDYLEDVEPGLETLLNTQEFVYYSYYSRIKTQLRQFWEPKIKEKMRELFRKGRRIAFVENKITKVVITLDKEGTLIRVQVLNKSGVEDLDDVAIEAFKSAAPFPNPPKGIVDKDGTIKIKWSFVLEA